MSRGATYEQVDSVSRIYSSSGLVSLAFICVPSNLTSRCILEGQSESQVKIHTCVFKRDMSGSGAHEKNQKFREVQTSQPAVRSGNILFNT